MRIAFFTETFLPATDGVVTRLKHTIEELLGMGDEMLVIAPKYGEGPGSYEGVPIHRVSSVPFPPYPQIKLAPINPGVGTALRGFGPELIHAVNPFVLGRGAPFYSRRLDVPLVASYHTNIAAYARFYRLGLFDRATRWYTRKLHNRAAINLCTSEATLRYLVRGGRRAAAPVATGCRCRALPPRQVLEGLAGQADERPPGRAASALRGTPQSTRRTSVG